MKTTIELPDELVREIKMRSLLDGRKLKDTIADLLRAGLGSAPQASGRAGRKKREFPIVECRRAAEQKAELTPERVAEVLTQQDASWHAKARR